MPTKTTNSITGNSAKVTQFDRPSAKSLIQTATHTLNALLKEHGIVVESRGGKFSGGELTAKFRFVLPVNMDIVNKTANVIRDSEVKMGLAIRGMKLMHRGRSVTISESRRKKYVFSYDDTPNKLYTASFWSFSIPSKLN